MIYIKNYNFKIVQSLFFAGLWFSSELLIKLFLDGFEFNLIILLSFVVILEFEFDRAADFDILCDETERELQCFHIVWD